MLDISTIKCGYCIKVYFVIIFAKNYISEVYMDSFESTRNYWNELHKEYERENIIYDDWLDLFLDDINNCTLPIIDLGCGSGNDSKYLIEHGKKVVACDYAENAVENARKNFPELIDAKCFDMTEGLPFGDGYAGIIVADLSLHYFSEEVTKSILAEIKRVLDRDGKLIFRVNSINDVNHGAGQGTEVEHHYFLNRHTIRNCVAWKNKAAGFYANHSSGGNDWINNTAYMNGNGFNMWASTWDANGNRTDGVVLKGSKAHVMKNNIAFPNKTSYIGGNYAAGEYNTWNLNITPKEADFFVGVLVVGIDGDRGPGLQADEPCLVIAGRRPN